MRIGIDARLNAYRYGGIPQYTYQLSAALVEQSSSDQFVLLQHWRQRKPLLPMAQVQRATLVTPPHHRLERYSLALEVWPRQLDLLHCPDMVVPRLCPCPTVVTIHDLAFVRYPYILDQAAQRYYHQVFESIWRASAVIAVSEATRRDIVHVLGRPAAQIDVVYEAAAPSFRPLSLPDGDTRSFASGLARGRAYTLTSGEFVLFVSTLEPRKNIPTLLQAVHICCKRPANPPYRLVLAGARGWHDDGIFKLVHRLGLDDVVVFLGGVDQETLLWLYNACRVYVNPSLYEGFGLPVLEAMACGAPSLVSHTSSLPEVAGSAAVLLAPLDTVAWADALEHIWHNADERASRRQQGLVQAARFSWQQAARETLAIYRRLVLQ
ncbi:MAG: glycosyltransferase family 4 protein [Chloroflexaceae bacterium]|nr:glycosyltransferase family 4 protein [Chloroflexaceae bacterium]